MAKTRKFYSLKHLGSLEWMDAEFGSPVVWNVLAPGVSVILNNGRKYLFGKVTLNEHLRNCHMLTFEFTEVLEHNYSSMDRPHRDDRNPRLKKQPGFEIFLWNTNEVTNRTRRQFLSERGTAKNEPLLDDSFREQAAKRKAYASHRHHLMNARHTVHTAFEVLGLPADASMQDLKVKRRELLTTFHPDLLQVFISKGGNADDFSRKSKQITDSIADAKEYIERRDATQQVYEQFTKSTQGE